MHWFIHSYSNFVVLVSRHQPDMIVLRLGLVVGLLVVVRVWSCCHHDQLQLTHRILVAVIENGTPAIVEVSRHLDWAP